MALRMTIYALSLFALMLSPSIAQSKNLSGSQIRSLLSGKSFVYSGPTSGTVRYTAGGKVSNNDSKYGRNTGRWWTTNTSYCRKFGKGKTKCMRIRELGNGRYRSSNGYTFSAR